MSDPNVSLAKFHQTMVSLQVIAKVMIGIGSVFSLEGYCFLKIPLGLSLLLIMYHQKLRETLAV